METEPQQLLRGVGEQQEEDKVKLLFEQHSFPARKTIFYMVSLQNSGSFLLMASELSEKP